MAGQVLSAHRSMVELVDASILSESTKSHHTLPVLVSMVPRQQDATCVVTVMASLRSRGLSSRPCYHGLIMVVATQGSLLHRVMPA